MLAITMLTAAVGIFVLLAGGDQHVPATVRNLHDIELTAPAIAPVARRPIYRYSVVPGGVYDRSDLQAAVATDALVAAHYADFDVTRARVTRVDKPRAVHVSYRLGNKIYWTRKKVWLRPGEALLSDGTQEARGRCGNRVCEFIPGPVAPEEPADEALDEPLPEMPPGIQPLRGFDLLFAHVPFVPSQPLPELEPIPSQPLSILPDPPAIVVESLPPPTPTVPLGPVPEPGTLILLGTGASFLAARLRRRQS